MLKKPLFASTLRPHPILKGVFIHHWKILSVSENILTWWEKVGNVFYDIPHKHFFIGVTISPLTVSKLQKIVTFFCIFMLKLLDRWNVISCTCLYFLLKSEIVIYVPAAHIYTQIAKLFTEKSAVHFYFMPPFHIYLLLKVFLQSSHLLLNGGSQFFASSYCFKLNNLLNSLPPVLHLQS